MTNLLDEKKIRLHKRLSTWIDSQKQSYFGSISQLELDLFPREIRGARLILDDKLDRFDSDVLLVSVIAETRGITLKEMANEIIQQDKYHTRVFAYLVGTAHIYREQIEQAETEEQLNNIDFSDLEGWEPSHCE
jgi:hypothetical protein